ncbi:hypothetical protein [Halochromatium salexigens]|nr:hypothetical protein [Halochromatium salexigens]
MKTVKVLPLLALLLMILGWVLTLLTGITLLSGPYEEGRTCQTECVQTMFFSGLGATVVALLIAGLALRLSDGRALTYISLVLLVPLGMIYAGLIVIGELA